MNIKALATKAMNGTAKITLDHCKIRFEAFGGNSNSLAYSIFYTCEGEVMDATHDSIGFSCEAELRDVIQVVIDRA